MPIDDRSEEKLLHYAAAAGLLTNDICCYGAVVLGTRRSLGQGMVFLVTCPISKQYAVASRFSEKYCCTATAKNSVPSHPKMPMRQFPTQELRKRLEAISRELDVVRSEYLPGDPLRLDALTALTRELLAVQLADCRRPTRLHSK